MIGKLAGALGRRGVIKGALGLGAAVGLGAGVAKPPPMVVGAALGSGGFSDARGIRWLPMDQASTGGNDPPRWVEDLRRVAEAANEAERYRSKIDGLDVDLAMLRGPTPAWKLATQRARDKARSDASRTLWQRFNDAQSEWYRSLTR